MEEGGVAGPEVWFDAPEIAASTVTVMVVGDLGINGGATIARLNTTDSFDFILHVGDITYADNRPTGLYDAVWRRFFAMLSGVMPHKAYMTLPGNHEFSCMKSGLNYMGPCQRYAYNYSLYNSWFRANPAPSCGSGSAMFYSYNTGPVHWVSFSTETDYPHAPTGRFSSADQLQWLEADLRAVNRTATPWVVAAGHRMVYDSAMYTPGKVSVPNSVMKAFESLFLRHRVDLVITGHLHAYERMRPVANFTVHGTSSHPGAPVYVVNGAAGCCEGHDTLPINGTHWPDWLVWRDNSYYGHAQLHATQSTLSWSYRDSVSGNVLDAFTLDNPWKASPQTGQALAQPSWLGTLAGGLVSYDDLLPLPAASIGSAASEQTVPDASGILFQPAAATASAIIEYSRHARSSSGQHRKGQYGNVVPEPWVPAGSIPGGDPDYFPVGACMAASYTQVGGGQLLAFGGSLYPNRTLMYSHATRNWTIAGSMPSARSYAAAATWNEQVVIAGGWQGLSQGTTLSSVLRYSLGSGHFTPLATLTVPRYGLMVEVLDGAVYCMGGGDVITGNFALDTVERLEMPGGAVRVLDPMPSPVVHAGSISTGSAASGGIFILGGLGLLQTPQDSIYRFDGSKWTVHSASLPAPLAHHAAAVLGGKVYLVGGYSGSAEDVHVSSHVWSADLPDLDDWVPAPDLPSSPGNTQSGSDM
eukprot:gene7425-1328_t